MRPARTILIMQLSNSRVYFAGVNTGCCVLHSAFDFYDDLVDCTVIEDLCGSTSGIKEHEEGISVLRSCITKERVVTAEEALREINRISP